MSRNMSGNMMGNRLLRKIDTFPLLPTIAGSIMQISSNPDASLADMKKVIETDSAMVVEVLKLANSPFFGFRRRVATLEHAISLVGMSEIKNLVLARSMFQVFRSAPGFDPMTLWRHSFYCGLAAKVVAPPLSLDPNELFVAGLIHDIGKLIIYMELDRGSIEELEADRLSIIDTTRKEEAMVGIGHDQLGLRLLRKWMFPGALTAAAGYHHQPEYAAGDQRDKLFPFAVHLADILSYMAEDGTSEEQAYNLENLILAPVTCRIAKKSGLELNPNQIKLFKKQLKQSIENESGIISLLTNGNDL
ncbi:MAG: HDOD domain-containing protein [bacterium]|nr:HDOD domain-containing protein [bacterium]